MEQDKKSAELEQQRTLAQEQVLEKMEELEEKELEPVETEIGTSEVIEKKRRREVIFEMALFFVLGLLLGVTIKTEAVKRITIGFNDYLIVKPLQGYDVSALKKNIDDQIAKQEAEQQVLDQQVPDQQ